MSIVARPSLYADIATLWRKQPEVDRKTGWSRELVGGTRLEERDGEVAAMTGLRTADGAVLYIRGRSRFMPPVSGDRVAYGNVSDIEPQTDALTVLSVEAHRLRGRLHHWEVALR